MLSGFTRTGSNRTDVFATFATIFRCRAIVNYVSPLALLFAHTTSS